MVGDGVWRIRRKERTPVIEISKHEETGHGDIVSDEFINWRIKLAMTDHGVEANGSSATTLQDGPDGGVVPASVA